MPTRKKETRFRIDAPTDVAQAIRYAMEKYPAGAYIHRQTRSDGTVDDYRVEWGSHIAAAVEWGSPKVAATDGEIEQEAKGT
jgi:hypothetical protein